MGRSIARMKNPPPPPKPGLPIPTIRTSPPTDLTQPRGGGINPGAFLLALVIVLIIYLLTK